MAEKQEILVANLTLDTYQKNNIPPLVIPQGDYGARVIRVRITEQGRPVTVTTSEAASIVAERIGDGESKAFSGTVNEDGTVNVPVTQWMLDLPDDDVICHVVITGNDYQYSTTEFLIEPKQKANPTEISRDDPRQDIVTEILANESARQAAEATRRANETGREAEEDARKEAEAKRLQDEELRTANEALRVTAESEREAAEDQRSAAESERAIAEAGRKKEIETLDQRVSKTEKRITNIEQGVMADVYETDDSVAYVKDVPTNALPYAAISKVGGMTYKDGDVLRSASATKVESVGGNLFDISKLSGMDRLVVSGDKINITTTSDNSAVSSVSRLKDVAPQLKVGDIVTINAITTGNDKYIYLEEAFKPWYYGYPQTITEIMLNSRISFYASGVSTSATISEIMLNKGTTALPYAPYVKHTLPIPTEVRPAHGINNEVYDYLDFGEQESVVRVGVVDLGTLNWTSFVQSIEGNAVTYFRTSVSPTIKQTPNASTVANMMCTHYKVSSQSQWFNNDKSVSYLHPGSTESVSYILVYDSDYTDVASFKAAMAGVMLYYELAEPIVTDISDILPADNLIGVEGGGTITMVNEHEYAVPSEIIYQVKGVSV